MEESMLTSKRKRFQLTSLSPEEKQRLGIYIKQLGGTFLDQQVFAKQVTHVVCGKPNRGEKYLGGCVSGRWVLRKEFIEDSFKQGKWLNEEEYEWGSGVLQPCSSLARLYDAPKKWRTALKNNEGGFKNWNAIVHVQDSKMKKAYERLLQAGSATILRKKVPFESTDLTKGVTHVFVDSDLKCEVLCFETRGIPCLPPDYIPEYIIQVAKEEAMNGFTMKDWNKNVMNTVKIPIKSTTKKTVRGVLPGKENGLDGTSVPETMRKPSVRKGTKRQRSDCDLCMAKRQKTQNELFPHCKSYAARKANKNTKSNSLVFPTYTSNIVESCVEEGYIFLALNTISSSLSSRHVPSPEHLQMLMNEFLLNSPSKQQAVQTYHLLQEILSLHPPATCQSLYLKALEEPRGNCETDGKGFLPWKFISKIIRCSLEGISSQNEETNRIQDNADLLLQFLDNLFKQDANTTKQPQTPMILGILWPHGTATCETRIVVKEFVILCYKCVKLALHDSFKLVVCQMLLDMLSLAVTLKKRDDQTGQDCCEFLAQHLSMVMSKDSHGEATKLLLQSCHSSWLKMRIAEFILGNFDKSLIPREYKPLVDKILSLQKITSCYFFLLPKTMAVQNGKSKKCKDTKQRFAINKTSRINLQGDKLVSRFANPKATYRKNAKGETPLHAACIRNDVLKVEEILSMNVDVNVADNAGWTALHEACNHGHLQCVEKILQYHDRTNKVNLLASPPDGTTVLHDAVGNHHLLVVKLLVEAGGARLLEAKTSAGKTALDLAETKKMADFLKLEMNKLKKDKELLLQPMKPLQPLAEEYDKVMNRECNKLVSMDDCQEYLFLVSQLLQMYVKEKMLPFSTCRNYEKFCKNCNADLQCWKNLSQHVDSIERHAKLLTGKQELSPLCQLYITTMRFCNT